MATSGAKADTDIQQVQHNITQNIVKNVLDQHLRLETGEFKGLEESFIQGPSTGLTWLPDKREMSQAKLKETAAFLQIILAIHQPVHQALQSVYFSKVPEAQQIKLREMSNYCLSADREPRDIESLKAKTQELCDSLYQAQGRYGFSRAFTSYEQSLCGDTRAALLKAKDIKFDFSQQTSQECFLSVTSEKERLFRQCIVEAQERSRMGDISSGLEELTLGSNEAAAYLNESTTSPTVGVGTEQSVKLAPNQGLSRSLEMPRGGTGDQGRLSKSVSLSDLTEQLAELSVSSTPTESPSTALRHDAYSQTEGNDSDVSSRADKTEQSPKAASLVGGADLHQKLNALLGGGVTSTVKTKMTVKMRGIEQKPRAVDTNTSTANSSAAPTAAKPPSLASLMPDIMAQQKKLAAKRQQRIEAQRSQMVDQEDLTDSLILCTAYDKARDEQKRSVQAETKESVIAQAIARRFSSINGGDTDEEDLTVDEDWSDSDDQTHQSKKSGSMKY